METDRFRAVFLPSGTKQFILAKVYRYGDLIQNREALFVHLVQSAKRTCHLLQILNAKNDKNTKNNK